MVEPAVAGQDLQTRLVVVDLRDAPVYEAISYTWGDSTDRVLLKCNGRTVPIPRNLEDALKQIRYSDRCRYVWADAVCINQEDLAERGQQVSIMRLIFQGAQRVLVWLGQDHSDQASKAFSVVCDIARSWRPPNGRLRFSSYAKALEPGRGDEQNTLREVIDEAGWAALRAMFEARYFRRFWIIQELALPSTSLVIWGKHHIAWGLVGICATWLLTRGWTFGYGTPIAAAYNAFLIYVLPLAKHSGISRFSKLDLSVVLGTTVDRFDSTDPRDRIYALLGMPFSGNDPDVGPLLMPDYRKTVRSVYVDAARCMLQQDGHLRLLSAVQHDQEIDVSYPSWVPQWNKPHRTEPLGLRAEQGYYANGGELFFPSEETFGSDGESLLVTGLECNTVVRVSEHITNSNLSLTSMSSDLDKKALSVILAHFNDEERELRASWSATLERFTLFGFNNPQVQAEATVGSGYQIAVTTGTPGKYGMRESTEIVNGERAQVDHLGEFLLYWRERSTWRAHELQHETLRDFWQSVQGDPYKMERALCSFNALSGRRIFHCDDGNFGLGPVATQAGDKVAVLFGGVVPFVLRPLDSGQWQLVGECFVPGLMQGEAVEAAGLLQPGSFDRSEDDYKHLRLTPVPLDGSDLRFHRSVGDQSVRRFELR